MQDITLNDFSLKFKNLFTILELKITRNETEIKERWNRIKTEFI